MKCLRTIVLFNKGQVLESADWRAVHDACLRGIRSVEFPAGSGALTIRRRVRQGNQFQRNGVNYLKNSFVNHMVTHEGWTAEQDVDIVPRPAQVLHFPQMTFAEEQVSARFGSFDLYHRARGGLVVAIEWETGNISSSHRSMNKLAVALGEGQIGAALLIVPSRALYTHLTDRIGNIDELSGYIALWQATGERLQRGTLAIAVVEHDALTDSPDVDFLPTGNDGRAREGRARRLIVPPT